jgi:hypothetical protein
MGGISYNVWLGDLCAGLYLVPFMLLFCVNNYLSNIISTVNFGAKSVASLTFPMLVTLGCFRVFVSSCDLCRTYFVLPV